MESGSRTAKSLEKYWKAWTNINLLKTFILQVKPCRFFVFIKKIDRHFV